MLASYFNPELKNKYKQMKTDQKSNKLLFILNESPASIEKKGRVMLFNYI